MLTRQTGFSSDMSRFWPVNIMKKKLKIMTNLAQNNSLFKTL